MRLHPVVLLPPDVEVLDLRGPVVRPSTSRWTIGRYDEVRAIYTQPLFGGVRNVHMGLDIGGPVGVAVHAFAPGVVLHAGYNPADGDYGYTIVTEHTYEGRPLYALFGHLSAASLGASPVGRPLQAGDVLGWLGDRHENGGWPPHVHIQLCWERPDTFDLPGAVSLADRDAARAKYPDPRMVVGRLYGD